jgi:hypothetical protein
MTPASTARRSSPSVEMAAGLSMSDPINAECRMPNAEWRTANTGCRIPNAEYRMLMAEYSTTACRV